MTKRHSSNGATSRPIAFSCIRWYLRFALNYRDIEKMAMERGLHISLATTSHWIQHFASELERHYRLHVKITMDFWSVDETFIKVEKV